MSEDEGVALNGFPHAEEIGIRLMKTPKGEAKITIPYDEKLVGDPETGVVHGGVVTAARPNTAAPDPKSIITRPPSAFSNSTQVVSPPWRIGNPAPAST